MDGLTFADHLIGHLMWPLIAVIALVAFYPVIRERIAVLERLKVGPSGLEGEFGSVLEKSDRTMAAATVPPPPPDVVEDRQRFERIAEISPRAAVLEAFTVVDNALKQRLIELGVTPEVPVVSEVRSTDAIVDAQRVGLLDNAAGEVWKNLRALSNAARHEPGLSITREQAIDYARLAAQLLSTIKHAVPTIPQGTGPAATPPAQPPPAAPAPAPAASQPRRPVAPRRGRPGDDVSDDPLYDPVNSPS